MQGQENYEIFTAIEGPGDTTEIRIVDLSMDNG